MGGDRGDSWYLYWSEGYAVKTVVLYNEDGTIDLVVSERTFREFYRLVGKSEAQIDAILANQQLDDAAKDRDGEGAE